MSTLKRTVALASAMGVAVVLLSSPPATAGKGPQPAPVGQRIDSHVLSRDAVNFASSAGGWTTFGGAVVAQDRSIGRAAAGALKVSVVTPWSGAMSPAFPVVPGDRYAADVYARAAGGGQMALAIQFRSSDGAVMNGATQIAQPTDDPSDVWTALHTVEGIAPDGATTAVVLVLDDNGAVGGADRWLDDVSVLHISGAPAPLAGPLHTSGRTVLDRFGREVTFRGVTIDGLEYRPDAAATAEEIDIASRWGANFVRIPLSENFWLPGDCLYAEGYQEHVDELVNQAASHGMFALLDLHTNSYPACTTPRQQKAPDADAVPFWKQVAARYANKPLVGFELYNEPHDITDAMWKNGGSFPVLGGTASYATPGMKPLYDAVRSTGANNLVFLSGNGWSTLFPSTAPLAGVHDVVYGVHAYTCPGGVDTPANCSTGPDGSIYDPSGILDPFIAKTNAYSVPVMLTEFGFPNRNDERFFGRGIDYMEAHPTSGWSGYGFDNTTLGAYDLWRTPPPLAEPAPSGMIVMRGLALD